MRNKYQPFIPRKTKFTKPKVVPTKYQKTVQRQPLAETIEEHADIDFKQLSVLVNICHLVADVNEQLCDEIHEIIRKADPSLELQFHRPIKQIKYHSADMVSFVDKNTNEKFSENFGKLADALKTVIVDFVSEYMMKKE